MPDSPYHDDGNRDGSARPLSTTDRLALLMLAIVVGFLGLGVIGLMLGLSNAAMSIATGGFYLAMFIFYRAFRKRGL
jgi:hypothetical protein